MAQLSSTLSAGNLISGVSDQVKFKPDCSSTSLGSPVQHYKQQKYVYRRVAEIQFFEKTYLIVIKDETDLKFKINDSTLFLIGSYVKKLVASY